MIYTELVERNMADVSGRGNLVPVTDVRIGMTQYERYCSLFQFNQEAVDYVAGRQGLTEGDPPKAISPLKYYKGPAAISYLWIDFDKEGDLPGVMKDVGALAIRLQQAFSLDPEALHYWFSGGKGFHVGIPAKTLALQGWFSESIPELCKRFVTDIAQGIPTIDTGIYNHTRIFRLPYSQHRKTGMYKIPVPWPLILNGQIDQVLAAATDCLAFDGKPQPAELNTAMAEYFRKITAAPQPAAVSTGRPTGSNLFDTPVTDWNKTFYAQAYRLFSVGAQRGLRLNKDEIWTIMRGLVDLANHGASKPFPDRDFDKFMKSALNRAVTNNPIKEGVAAKSTGFAGMASKAREKTEGKEPIPTGIPAFDAALGGGFKPGNFYPLIGANQTMKSLFSDKILRDAGKAGVPGVLCQGEMGALQELKRWIQAEMQVDITDLVKAKNWDQIETLAAQLDTILNGKVKVITDSGLDPESLEATIKAEEDAEIFVIDSFNKLVSESEYKGNLMYGEVLKGLAKDYGVVILLIIHTRSGVDKWARDTASFVRGGSKIVDDADGYLCFSRVIDPAKSELSFKAGRKLEYYKSMIWIRCVDKRATGVQEDAVFELNDQLQFIPAEGDAEEWEVKFY